MNYTVIINGHSYDLPKKTIAVMEKLEEVITVDSNKGMGIRDKFGVLHDFIVELVGEKGAKEILGADNLSEADLSDVTLTVKKIVEAYDKPLKDYQMEQGRKALDGIPIEKIIALGNTASRMGDK